MVISRSSAYTKAVTVAYNPRRGMPVKRVMSCMRAAALVSGVLIGGTGLSAQTAPAASTPQAYDSAKETDDKLFDLSMWVLDHTADARNPANATQEYMDRVLAILEKREPRPFTLEDYMSVATENVDITYKGDWLADVFLKLGPGGKVISRNRIGGDAEITVYEWRNADGSAATVMFANGRVIRKSQTGLQ